MTLKSWLKKRLGKISLRNALIFTLINIIFLLYFSNTVIRLALFSACALLLYYFGRLPFDIDFIPLSSGLLMLWYEPMIAMQFALWTIPAAHVIAAQFNQWTFVNLFSLLAGLGISAFFRTLDYKLLLSLVIILYNIFRSIITSIFMKQGINGIQASFTHTFIYLVIVFSIPF